MSDNPFADALLAKSGPVSDPTEMNGVGGTQPENDFRKALMAKGPPVTNPTQIGMRQPPAKTIQPQPALPQRIAPESRPDVSWSDVGQGAIKSILPSTGHMLGGIYEAVRHPIDTATALGSLAQGIDAKIERSQGRQVDPAMAPHEAAVDALVQSYKDKYGSVKGLQYALKDDPASVLLDASTLFTGGAGAAGKVAGVVGKVDALAPIARGIQTTANVARTAGEAINPLNPLGVVTGAAGKILPKTAGSFDANLASPKLQSVIKSTLGEEYNPSSLSPASQKIFADTIAQKGVNAPAVREAMIKIGGGTPTAAMATGKVPHPAAADIHAEALRENPAAFGAKAAGISGAPEASRTDLAETLNQSRLNSRNNVEGLYNQAFSHEGEFHPDVGGDSLINSINSELDNVTGIPNSADDLSKIKDPATGKSYRYPQAQAAIGLLRRELPGAATAQPLNIQHMEEIRRAVGSLYKDAQGEDRVALRSILEGFDKHLEGSAAAGLWNGPTGDALSADMRNARMAFKQHRATFEDPSGGNSVISAFSRGMKTLDAPSTGGVGSVTSADAAVYQQAQKSLEDALMKPNTGPNLYNKLRSAMGNDPDAVQKIHDFVKQHVLRLDPAGRLVLPEAKINEFLNYPNGIARVVFTPQEIAEVRAINHARRLSAAKPATAARHESLATQIGSEAAKHGVRGLSAYAGYNFGPIGAMGAYAAERGVESALNKIRGSALRNRELMGAPAPGLVARGINAVTRAPFEPMTANTLLASQYPEGRQGRASGGKVSQIDHASKADALVRAAESARKAISGTTEPLLDMPDESVVKALAVAGEAI